MSTSSYVYYGVFVGTFIIIIKYLPATETLTITLEIVHCL